MKKIALFLVSILAVVAAIAPFYLNTSETLGQTQLKRFSSYDELKSFLKESSHGGSYYDEGSGRFIGNELFIRTVIVEPVLENDQFISIY